MYEKKILILRLLLNRYHKENRETVLKGLSEQEAKKILAIPLDSGDVKAILLHEHETMQNIHYSWFIKALENVEKSKRPLVLALLPDHQAAKLREYFRESSEKLELSKSLKRFLFMQFYSILKPDGALPLAYLPVSEISDLATFNKNKLVEVIDYLGLYDLAAEIHRIVDKQTLGQIYASLTKNKLNFLRQCLRQKEKLVTQRLKLDTWDGDSRKLNKMLHQKGILRLGYALSGEHPDFLWHVSHILDIGRGEKLSSSWNSNAIAGVTPTLRNQVKNLLKFLKQVSGT